MIDIRHQKKLEKGGDKECDCCDKKAEFSFFVKDGWYVGNMDQYFVCHKHLSLAKGSSDILFKHYRSKEWFVKKQDEKEWGCE